MVGVQDTDNLMRKYFLYTGYMNDDRYNSGESGCMDIIRGLLPHGECEKEYWLPTGLVKRIFYKGSITG